MASMTRLEPGQRVFIVDDADRFNESSANAFLKTLEEPPADLTFVLLAANSAQMLTTIVSRCQSVRFSPLTPTELGQAVAGFEGLPAGEERELLLRVAQGSPGRVARMLELGVLKIAEDFITAATRDPFKASEALGAALIKGPARGRRHRGPARAAARHSGRGFSHAARAHGQRAGDYRRGQARSRYQR